MGKKAVPVAAIPHPLPTRAQHYILRHNISFLSALKVTKQGTNDL